MTEELRTKLSSLRENMYREAVKMLQEFGVCHLTCATGFGKTVIFKRYVSDNPEERILYVTDRASAAAAFEEYAKRINSTNAGVTYQFLSWDSKLDERLKFIDNNRFTTLIFDESHLTGANNCEQIIDYAKDKGVQVFGGSATPLRTDGINVAMALFDGHSLEYSVRQAWEDGFILRPRTISTVYLAIRIRELQNKLRGKAGSKWAISKLSAMERAIADRDSLKSTIGEALSCVDRGIWIVFHPNILALNMMRGAIDDAFLKNAPDVRTFAVSSDKEHINVAQFAEQHNGFSVVHSVNMLNTGWHFSDISGLVINSLTDSPVRGIQQLGRAIELGSLRQTVIVDIIGRFTSQKNKFIVDTELMGTNVGSTGVYNREEAWQYTVDTVDRDIDFMNILDAIETWASNEYRMTSEEAVMTVRKYNHTLKTASRASGVPESLLKELI